MRAFSPRAVSSTDPSFDRFEPAVSPSFRELIFKDLSLNPQGTPIQWRTRTEFSTVSPPFEWRASHYNLQRLEK